MREPGNIPKTTIDDVHGSAYQKTGTPHSKLFMVNNMGSGVSTDVNRRNSYPQRPRICLNGEPVKDPSQYHAERHRKDIYPWERQADEQFSVSKSRILGLEETNQWAPPGQANRHCVSRCGMPPIVLHVGGKQELQRRKRQVYV